MSRKLGLVVFGSLLVAGCGGQLPVEGEESAQGVGWGHMKVCADVPVGFARCHSHVVVDGKGGPSVTATPAGYGPADLQSAYALPGGTAGSGQTVGIVDAYDNPNAEADLAVYRKQYGLPPCTTANGCFKKIDQNGTNHYPRGSTSWGQEIDLDIETVSAVCPNCKIILVATNSASMSDLGAGVNAAVAAGANVVSNSYGGGETAGQTSDTYFNHPGVVITASSGDNGYGAEYPASSQYVTAVGGTNLKKATNARGWTETAWTGAGSGCSKYSPKPAWQHDSDCNMRTVADVSAVADPNTGVAVYDSYGSRRNTGWMVFGGTSVASPLIAAVYALGAGSAGASTTYANSSALNDVTSGSNGSCSGSYLCIAGAGYDGPTGLGTPNGTGAF
jgi:subtilase family serine protease